MPTSLYSLYGTQEKIRTQCRDRWREKLFELKNLMGFCTQREETFDQHVLVNPTYR